MNQAINTPNSQPVVIVSNPTQINEPVNTNSRLDPRYRQQTQTDQRQQSSQGQPRIVNNPTRIDKQVGSNSRLDPRFRGQTQTNPTKNQVQSNQKQSTPSASRLDPRYRDQSQSSTQAVKTVVHNQNQVTSNVDSQSSQSVVNNGQQRPVIPTGNTPTFITVNNQQPPQPVQPSQPVQSPSSPQYLQSHQIGPG